MAMGDNFNDLSMLQKVGHPVAMGNAEQEIKNIIPNHTTSNNEDGVGRAIYQALNVLK
nr:HAD hydrolase family protein [Heyndrickxia oleronia]